MSVSINKLVLQTYRLTFNPSVLYSDKTKSKKEFRLFIKNTLTQFRTQLDFFLFLFVFFILKVHLREPISQNLRFDNKI